MVLARGIDVLLLCLPVALYGAEVKRWVDADGGIHFGDIAPKDASVEVQELNPVSVTPGQPGLRLRPGEIEALRRYEQRGQSGAAASEGLMREPTGGNTIGDRADFYHKRCEYYRQRQAFFRDWKRHGYSRSDEAKIDERIAWSEMKVAEYCR